MNPSLSILFLLFISILQFSQTHSYQFLLLFEAERRLKRISTWRGRFFLCPIVSRRCLCRHVWLTFILTSFPVWDTFSPPTSTQSVDQIHYSVSWVEMGDDGIQKNNYITIFKILGLRFISKNGKSENNISLLLFFIQILLGPFFKFPTI